MSSETLTIPIFPLPNVVLFPGMLMPLHIFEPRYKDMINDVLESEQHLVGLVQLRPGWEQDYYGSPAVYKTLGIGKMIKSRRWDDGRFDILLEGCGRAQIVRESPKGDYRMAEVNMLEDFVPMEARDDVDSMHKKLLKLINVVLEAVPAKALSFKDDIWNNMTVGTVADVLAAMLVDDGYEKQCILSELDIARRLKLVQVQLRMVLKPTE